MIPHYVVHHQECERCKATIYIGYECVSIEGEGFFCSEECAMTHLYHMSGAKKIYLTNDKTYREVD